MTDICSYEHRILIIRGRTTRLLDSSSRSSNRYLFWLVAARETDGERDPVAHPCYVVLRDVDVLPPGICSVSSFEVAVRVEERRYAMALSDREYSTQCEPPTRSKSLAWPEGDAPLVVALQVIAPIHRAMTRRSYESPLDALDDAASESEHSRKQRVIVLPAYYSLLDALPPSIASRVRQSLARAPLVDGKWAHALEHIGRFVAELPCAIFRRDVHLFIDYFADAFSPSALIELTPYIRPSSLARAFPRELAALIRLLNENSTRARTTLGVVTALAHALPSLELPRQALAPAATYQADEMRESLEHIQAWCRRMSRTRSTLSRSPQLGFGAATAPARSLGALIELDAEKNTMTTGRWALAEARIAEWLRHGVASLTLLTHVGNGASALIGDRLLDIFGEFLDVQFVAPNAAYAHHYHDHLRTDTIDDVIAGRSWERDSRRIVCVLDAHRIGVRSLYALLARVKSSAPHLVLVGDAFASGGAPRSDDPGAPFRDAAAAARAGCAWIHVETLQLECARSVGACGVLSAFELDGLASRYPRFDAEQLVAEGLDAKTDTTRFVVVRSFDEIPCDAPPILYALASHDDAAIAHAALTTNDADETHLRAARRSRYYLGRFILLSDVGECVRVSRFGVPATTRHYNNAATAIEWSNENAPPPSLDTRSLVIDGDGAVDHRRCCGINNSPSQRLLDIHAPYVRSGTAFSARALGSEVVPESLGQSVVLVLDYCTDQLPDWAPVLEPTLDDVRAAATLVSECVYVMCATANSITEALQQRARSPWTQLRRLLIDESSADTGIYRPDGSALPLPAAPPEPVYLANDRSLHARIRRYESANERVHEWGACTSSNVVESTRWYSSDDRISLVKASALHQSISDAAAAKPPLAPPPLVIFEGPLPRDRVAKYIIPDYAAAAGDRTKPLMHAWAPIKRPANAASAHETSAVLRHYTTTTDADKERLGVSVLCRLVKGESLLEDALIDSERALFAERLRSMHASNAMIARIVQRAGGAATTTTIDGAAQLHAERVAETLARAKPLIEAPTARMTLLFESLTKIREQWLGFYALR